MSLVQVVTVFVCLTIKENQDNFEMYLNFIQNILISNSHFFGPFCKVSQDNIEVFFLFIRWLLPLSLHTEVNKNLIYLQFPS